MSLFPFHISFLGDNVENMSSVLRFRYTRMLGLFLLSFFFSFLGGYFSVFLWSSLIMGIISSSLGRDTTKVAWQAVRQATGGVDG